MSLIHWNKSVVTFHLKEMVEIPNSTDRVTLAGLGAIAIVPLALPLLAKVGRPIAKAAIKSGLSLYYEGKTVLESGEERESQTGEKLPSEKEEILEPTR